MSESSERKIKLLLLYEILRKQTDERHPMTTGELSDALLNSGIAVSRKTLYEDIETLNRYGFEILCDKGRSNRYYVADHKFERPEIQILLQAIGAAKFLTEKKSSALSHKIAELLGESQAEEFASMVAKSHTKSGNEHIYYSIDAIMTALLEKKKLSFLYFDTDLYGKRTYRKSGERYEVNPLGMVYSGDYFYLICYHDKYGDAANYRIDRMDGVQAEKQKITYNARFARFDINAYRREIFSMYTGEQREVELLFPKEFAEIARDRFGESCRIVSDRDGYIVCTMVQVSKTFFSWLTTFEGKVKILRPAEVKEQFQAFIENIIKNLDVKQICRI